MTDTYDWGSMDTAESVQADRTLPLCFLSPFSDNACRYREDGLPDRAHLIKRTRLVLAGVDDTWDRRVWVRACRQHHHELDNGFITLTLADYPKEVVDFATEHNFFYVSNGKGWIAGHREAA